MEFLTATTIFLASLNVYGECGFAYNAETSEDGIVAAKTVYRKSVCGKYLSRLVEQNPQSSRWQTSNDKTQPV